MYDVVSLGEVLIDFTYYGISENGNALFEQNPGGAPANVLALCAGFGLKTAFIGKVGADMHGQFLRDVLKNKDINVDGLVMADNVFTTLAFVKLTNGERSFSFARKPGADTQLTQNELKYDIVSHTKVFHFGSLSLTNEPSRSTLIQAIKIAKSHGAIISYDPNYREPLWNSEDEAIREMRSLIQYADVMKISDEETKLLTNEKVPEKAAQILLDRGVLCVVVTLGAEGALVATNEGIIYRKPPLCNVVDTTGAGDTFWGAFLYKLIKGGKSLLDYSIDELADYISFANAAASCCVEKRGAMPSMPSLDEALDRYL